MAETPQSKQDLPAETTSSTAPTSDTPTKRAKPSRTGSGLALLCLFLLIATAGVGGWYGWQLWLQVQNLEQQVDNRPVQDAHEPFDPAPLERQLAELHERYLALENPAQEMQEEQAQRRAMAQLGRQLASLESRLAAISGTTRNDWKLAEAAFLLRMANQKVLLEHNSVEALAMTRAADAILQAQDDPGLFAVRQVLSDEVVQLQLADTVDKEGIYLRLQAAIDQVGALPVLQAYQRQSSNIVQAGSAPQADDAWGKVKNSVANAWRTLGSLIRVTRHDVNVAPLMAPEQAYFLRQNLRLMLEQAQTALLRESQPVYQQSLQESIAWLQTYFELSDAARVMAEELTALSDMAVQVELPDVDRAQRLLRDYIERLHQVQSEEDL
ncbi:uroporphyrinogen-III C-methyltransferase [Gilvimarinus sp. 1_MG-2023]|uniref:uroporphyrinogen-III C-methyltransferase n=1 Tax=Gilvimarinus sp. 1_MG-2023 TaxID=3062638 RepID=UPI0026E32EA7|nr:uroporphyrinogen-III C-methyltransferase [Gilvimarinus sp. 1_MG-2023]MDO6748378.1 uroporphyrinogen-III C-methyltransferase [Gilvimarinus sp. 1_MG-2023]